MIDKITQEEFTKTYRDRDGGLIKALELLLAKVNELVDAHNEQQKVGKN